jgi:hypothetical protein
MQMSLAQGSVLNSMYISGLVNTLVTHANMKGFGLTPMFGDRRGYMPPQLKTKTKQYYAWILDKKVSMIFLLLVSFLIFFRTQFTPRCGTEKPTFFLCLSIGPQLRLSYVGLWIQYCWPKIWIRYENK